MYKLHLNDIKITDVKKLQILFPEFNPNHLYITLLKALGYKNLGHFKNCYIIKEGKIIGLIEDRKVSAPFDITWVGLVYNEHVFVNSLRTTYSKAFKAKQLLERPNNFEDWSDGNIKHSDLRRVRRGIQEISDGNAARVMADYPLRFYTRYNKNYEIYFNGKITKIDGFVFDGFRLDDEKEYFAHKKFKDKYLKLFMNYFLKFDNVIFNQVLMDNHERENSYCVKFLSENFENYTLELDTAYNERLGKIRIFPKIEMSKKSEF